MESAPNTLESAGIILPAKALGIPALMGRLAEMIVRTHYESQNKTVYTVGEKINLN